MCLWWWGRILTGTLSTSLKIFLLMTTQKHLRFTIRTRSGEAFFLGDQEIPGTRRNLWGLIRWVGLYFKLHSQDVKFEAPSKKLVYHFSQKMWHKEDGAENFSHWSDSSEPRPAQGVRKSLSDISDSDLIINVNVIHRCHTNCFMVFPLILLRDSPFPQHGLDKLIKQ